LIGSPALVAGGTTMAAHGSTVINTALNNLAKSHHLNATQTPGDPKTQGVDDKAIKNNNGEPVKQTPKVEPKKNGGKQPKGESAVRHNGEAVKQGGDSSKMFGAKGTQTQSTKVWQDKGSKARIDVENPSPGERPGQVHYHDAKNKKYMYDPATDRFYDENPDTKNWDIEAPRSVNKLLKNERFRKGIEKALKYLGEID